MNMYPVPNLHIKSLNDIQPLEKKHTRKQSISQHRYSNSQHEAPNPPTVGCLFHPSHLRPRIIRRPIRIQPIKCQHAQPGRQWLPSFDRTWDRASGEDDGREEGELDAVGLIVLYAEAA